MDFMFPSINHENINNLNQEEEPPLFLHFPSPFLDDMQTTTMISNLHHISTHACTTTTATTTTTTKLKELVTSRLKSVRKKRGVGKKDRHSKIHTAQGLRDRRMRLSVHTARKFFDLNDMLGFDKASKTIEWLFSKSQKAIEEVAETLQSNDHDATQTASSIETTSHNMAPPVGSKENNVIESPCESESVMEINKDETFEIQGDRIEYENSRKPNESYPLVSESRNEVRARDTKMMEHLEKQKQLFHVQSQLGFSGNMEKSSCYPLEYLNTYHFLKHLNLDTTVRNPDDSYLGNITTNSSTNCSQYDYNKTIAEPPAGWLNSRNTFLGFRGGWDSGNSRMESNNGILPNIEPLRSNIVEENHSSDLMSSDFSNFHSQNEGQ